HLLRRLEERADVDVEAEVRERGRDDLRTAVVAVLADLRDEHPRAAAVVGREAVDVAAERAPLLVLGVLGAVDAGDGADLGVVAPPHLLERGGDLAHRRPRPRRLDPELEEVPLPAPGRARERL